MGLKLDELKQLKTEIFGRYEEVKEQIKSDMEIDGFRLDDEAIRTPKLHGIWMGVLTDEAIKLKQIQNLFKKAYLERWKYWSGTQTDKYYHEYGIVHNKILKTDVPIYMDADDFICELKEIVEVQEQFVMFLEKCIKEISGRTFHIKNAVEWRRFEAGN
jgi:hypothetical protein